MRFSVADWLSRNTPGGHRISPEARTAVADFTTIWNLFESALCHNRASVTAFREILARYREDHNNPEAIQTVSASVDFWRQRYRQEHDFNERFDRLYFRPKDRREHVEATLLGLRNSQRDQLLASLIIVYRLRNNLFHGIKSLDMLNDQVENLTVASQCLAAILELIPSRFVDVGHFGHFANEAN